MAVLIIALRNHACCMLGVATGKAGFALTPFMLMPGGRITDTANHAHSPAFGVLACQPFMLMGLEAAERADIVFIKGVNVTEPHAANRTGCCMVFFVSAGAFYISQDMVMRKIAAGSANPILPKLMGYSHNASAYAADAVMHPVIIHRGVTQHP